MRPYNLGMRRSLPAALLLALITPLAVHAEDEPPSPKPPVQEEVLLSSVVSDPRGRASRLAVELAAALGSEDHDRAYARLVTLAEDHGDVLLPLKLFGAARFGRTDGALLWPARRAANLALARMPESFRSQALERWSARIAALTSAARRGDERALAELAEAYGVSPAGATALLLLAERDLERGMITNAARRLETWLDLHADADATRRARVAVRLADALAMKEDAGALGALAVMAQEVREVPVRVRGKQTTLADRISTWRARRPTKPAAAAYAADAAKLEDPLVLWSRSIVDRDHLRHGVAQRGLGVMAGAWGRDNALVLHEGRHVRRLDLTTGLERWQFPRSRPVTMHAWSERYRGYDIPWRSVTPAGDSVLVVLGDPASSGRYTFLEQEHEADQLGQEVRLRLACLDLATGKLRWHTGALDDVHPVLGHRATGCSSPPLVVGKDVYCLFAQRLGATTFFLACLDVDTGKPRWVARLAAGESGRGDDQASGGNRFTTAYAQSVPFGARPSLAEGEVCALPHAGFAAGVDATRGTVMWARALPRYQMSVTVPANEGHNVRNQPVAWGDAWILAPMDGPRMVCVARGSGDLRWQRGEPTPVDSPEWRDVLGVVPDREGRPRLRLSGWRPYLMDPANGALVAGGQYKQWVLDGDDPGGAAVDVGAYVVRLAAGGLQARNWSGTGEQGSGAHLALDLERVPLSGDLVRVGAFWVAIGREGVAVLAQPDVARTAVPPGGTAQDAAGAAATLAVRATLETDVALLAAATSRAAEIEDLALRARVHALIAEQVPMLVDALSVEDDAFAQLQALAAVVRSLPIGVQGAPLQAVAEQLLDADAASKTLAAELLVHWLETADDTLVPLDGERGWWLGENRVRGDLIAARQLRTQRDDPAVLSVLKAREARAGRELEVALARANEDALRASIRRAAGTRAAHAARTVLARRLVVQERLADAAALAADMRLDPPWLGLDRPVATRLAEAGLLQLQEAGWLGAASEGERARALAADLVRWAPGGLQDAFGRTQTTLRDALRKRYGWHPVRGKPEVFDAWRGVPGPKDRDETRSIEFLELQGPGADTLDDTVVLVRGLTVELWSRRENKRLAVLQGPDEGWFGGSLSSIDGWVPEGGILVSSIVAGEPADLSGVRGGDWVHTWAGQPVRDLPGFMQLVAASEPGKTIPVGIWRGGRRILATFKAGRRPAAQGRLMDYGPLWVEAGGRILLPGRTGLSWIDAAKRRREHLWTWSEPGVVRRCDVLGGRAYVQVTRSLRPDVVVAVDLSDGRELWRQEVEGSVTRMAAVGSAVWVQSVSPGVAYLFDRRDGTPRARLRTFDRHRGEFRKNWEPDRAADVACGRGYMVSGGDSLHILRVINTTTCAVEHTDAWSYKRASGIREYANPQVAAGPFVSVMRHGKLRLYFPNPLGGAPWHQIDLPEGTVLSNQGHYGAINRDARVYIRGHNLYTVRVPLAGRRNVNVVVFEVDYDALRAREATERGPGAAVVHVRTKRTWMSGPSSPRRYVLNVRPGFEGLMVSGARLTGEHQGETWWVSPLDDYAKGDNRQLRLLERQMNEARRHAPVPIGPSLFVPTDEGALVYALRRYRDK